MEPFRDDREAAARRIEELEAENRALKQDLFVHKAPPPRVVSKPGLAPGLVVLFVALPLMLLVLGGAGAAFFMVRAPAPPPIAVPAEPADPVPQGRPPFAPGDPLAPQAVPTPVPNRPSSLPGGAVAPQRPTPPEPAECLMAEKYKDKDAKLYRQFAQRCAERRAGLD